MAGCVGGQAVWGRGRLCEGGAGCVRAGQAVWKWGRLCGGGAGCVRVGQAVWGRGSCVGGHTSLANSPNFTPLHLIPPHREYLGKQLLEKQ